MWFVIMEGWSILIQDYDANTIRLSLTYVCGEYLIVLDDFCNDNCCFKSYV